MLRWLTVAAIVVVVIAAVLRFRSLERQVDGSAERWARVEAMSDVSRVVVTGADGISRIFPRGDAETAAEWAARVRLLHEEGAQQLARYKCVELEGCEGGIKIMVCTLCAGLSGPACQEASEEDVGAFCAEFNCDC